MYRFKQAESPEEFEQIFRLNHDVFAGELGQYDSRADSRLVDKFHGKNRYAIALAGERVAGMAAFHDQAPFSVAEKLADPSVLARLGRVSEIRLLAIDPAHRNRAVLRGLLVTVFECARAHDTIVISGYAAEQKMYRELGFEPLGPPVESGRAEFVPMMIRVADLEHRAAKWRERTRRAAR